MALRRGINSDSVIHVCKEVGLFLLLADIMSSLTDVSEFAEFTRKHWSIENNLHWSLDVCFREDACQVRDVNANKVFAGLRKMVKFIIDKDKKTKAGQEIRRLKAAWDPTYRLSLLNGL